MSIEMDVQTTLATVVDWLARRLAKRENLPPQDDSPEKAQRLESVLKETEDVRCHASTMTAKNSERLALLLEVEADLIASQEWRSTRR